MRKLILTLIAVFCIIHPSDAQEDQYPEYIFDGYIYDMVSYQKMPDAISAFGLTEFAGEDDFWMNLTRARFTPELKFSTDSRITMHYEIDALWTKFALPFFTGTDKTNRQAIDLSWTPVNEDKVMVRHYIDMLYYKHMFDFGEIKFGRQVISWGQGRIWQPTDLFNPINPANFSKIERDGADAVSFKYYLGLFSDIEFVFNFRERWDRANFGARYRTNTGEYDISAMGGYFDDKIIIGCDFAGNLWDAGVRGEAIFAMHKDDIDSNYVRAILGIDHQITEDLYGMLEYQYNGEGTSDKTQYLQYFQRVLNGEMQNVGKNYIAASANYKFHPLISGTLTSITNINDGSGFAGIDLAYNILQNLNLGVGAYYFFGDKLDEYWYYSSAAFITGQFYF